MKFVIIIIPISRIKIFKWVHYENKFYIHHFYIINIQLLQIQNLILTIFRVYRIFSVYLPTYVFTYEMLFELFTIICSNNWHRFSFLTREVFNYFLMVDGLNYKKKQKTFIFYIFMNTQVITKYFRGRAIYFYCIFFQVNLFLCHTTALKMDTYFTFICIIIIILGWGVYTTHFQSEEEMKTLDPRFTNILVFSENHTCKYYSRKYDMHMKYELYYII